MARDGVVALARAIANEPPPVASGGDAALWRPSLRETLALETLQRLTGMVAGFPDLPVGTRQIMAALHDPDTTPHEIARITSSDPALAARILRVVNSSFYKLPHRISDLSHAIVLLGYTQVRNLALQGGIGPSLRTRDGARLELSAFWYHSFCCSICAFHFARKLRTVRPGQASTIALLHDIGKPVLWWSDPAARAGGVDGGQASTRERLMAEEEQFGVTHAALGALLAARWGLPPEIARGIEYHHHPGCTEPGLIPAEVRELASVLWMADRFAHRFAEHVGDEDGAGRDRPATSEGAATPDGAAPGGVASNSALAPLARWDATVLPALVDPDLHRELMRARALLDEREYEPAAS